MALSSDSSILLDISHLKNVKNKRISIIATEWNDKLVTKQIEGAKRIAALAGAIVHREIFVPGSFELPFAAKKHYEVAHKKQDAPDAIILFGAVIRGGTPHFEYVCKAITEGAVQLNLTLPVPVIFGVLTLDNEQQALERLGGSHGHKGEEAMIAALKMIDLEYG